ncbi:MAG: c-type cytochrome [Candidatus Latescibacterota bacterium]|nr:c-type cytochrome [Candidatus Latescibacterota bacterium]
MQVSRRLTLFTVVVACALGGGIHGQARAQTGDMAADGQGKVIYDDKCAHCHGAEGKGDGSGADRLSPRPRDFTRGQYKIRSTESRELPTDDDLFRIVTDGMPGTSMPGWPRLSDEERRAVVAYIKTFSKNFERATAPPLEIAMVDKVAPSEESVAEGRKIFEMLECAKCHGQQGRGDGPSALTLVDEWNYPTRPADLTMSWQFRGGDATDDLYRRFMAGLAGTPMPSIKDGFPIDMEVEDIQIMIEDEEEISPEEQVKYDDAMRDIRVKTWHLANYVRSLSPAQEPEVGIVLESALVEGELPQTADDPRWGEGEGVMFPLAGQVIIEPRLFTPTVTTVFAKSMHNGEELALLVTWHDPSVSITADDPGTQDTDADRGEQGETSTLGDALAVQFPTKISDGAVRPHFLMGDARHAAYAWVWQASPSTSPEARVSGDVREVRANGMTRLQEQPADAQDVRGRIAYADGRYQLLIHRSLRTEDKKDLQFDAGAFVPIAFAAWDGSNGEVGTRCSVSTWYFLLLEKPASNKPYLLGLVGALLTLAVQFGARRSARRGSE